MGPGCGAAGRDRRQAGDGGGELGRLRRFAQLTAPPEGDVQEATSALREAAAGLEAVAGSSAARARALAALLTAALPRLNSWGRSFADTYQALNRGAHGAHAGDLDLLVHDSRALADKIRVSLP